MATTRVDDDDPHLSPGISVGGCCHFVSLVSGAPPRDNGISGNGHMGIFVFGPYQNLINGTGIFPELYSTVRFAFITTSAWAASPMEYGGPF